MFDREKKLAPEPQFSLYLWVLEQAILYVRTRIRDGDPMPHDQLHDLLDAIENIPTFLREHGDWFVEDNMKAYLEVYDKRWGQRSGFRLSRCLQTGLGRMARMEQHHKRRAGTECPGRRKPRKGSRET